MFRGLEVFRLLERWAVGEGGVVLKVGSRADEPQMTAAVPGGDGGWLVTGRRGGARPLGAQAVKTNRGRHGLASS